MPEQEVVENQDSVITDTSEDDQKLTDDLGLEESIPPEDQKDVKEVKEEQKETPPTKYTDEELSALYESGGMIDRRRLTGGQEALRRMTQRGISKEKEELLREKEQIESEKKKLDPREQYYQSYVQEPVKIIKQINTEIARLRFEGDSESLTKISQLEDMKDEFRERKEIEREQRLNESSYSYQAKTEIFDKYPDFEKRASVMDAVLTEAPGGLTYEDIQQLVSPRTSKGMSIRFVKSMMHLHDKLNASKSAIRKEDKTPPPPLVRPGAKGDVVPIKKKGVWDMTDEEFEKQIAKAKFGGK